MAINNISLRKLLRLFYMTPPQLTAALRADIRNEISKANGTQSSGGDFHIPFWSDAKEHVAGVSNLSEQTKIRVAKNRARQRLYPLLELGFLQWWNEKRRWSNQEFEFLSDAVKGRFQEPNLDVIVKIENILALKIDDDTNRLIYPYFSEEPRLQAEGARIALWLLSNTFENFQIEDMRVLDILRSESFSISEAPLQGNEEDLFLTRYRHVQERWVFLREDYD